MDLIKIKEIASHLMKNRKVHLEREIGGAIFHGERTAEIALQLRELLLTNDSSPDDILKVASWFHDCGKGIEPHAKYGATIAREALEGYVSDGELDKICELITLHASRCPDSNDYDDYTKILQDADMLDHFGIYEIWINIQYYAHTDGTISDMINYYDTNHKSHTEKCRAMLNYKLSRIIFDEKVEFEKEYIARLNSEGTGTIYNIESLIK